MEDQIKAIIAALVGGIITHPAFAAAVKHEVGHAVKQEIESSHKDVEDGSYEELLSSDEFETAVSKVINAYDFDDIIKIDEDKIKDVVRNMDFSIEIGRY